MVKILVYNRDNKKHFEYITKNKYLIEAKIYDFLERNAHEAFTMPDIFERMIHEGCFREPPFNFSEVSNGGNYSNHPFYQLVQKKIDAMVNDGKIAGMYDQGRSYYLIY